jgi:hypothetical protein
VDRRQLVTTALHNSLHGGGGRMWGGGGWYGVQSARRLFDAAGCIGHALVLTPHGDQGVDGRQLVTTALHNSLPGGVGVGVGGGVDTYT